MKEGKDINTEQGMKLIKSVIHVIRENYSKAFQRENMGSTIYFSKSKVTYTVLPS